MIDKTKYCIYNINYSFNPVSVIISLPTKYLNSGGILLFDVIAFKTTVATSIAGNRF
jgi:hypothetical protein